MTAGRRYLWLVIFFGSLLLAGCKNRELAEYELRARDGEYYAALLEMGISVARNQTSQSDPDAPRKSEKETAANRSAVREPDPAFPPAPKQANPNIPVGVWYVPPLPSAVELGRPVPQAPQAVWPPIE